MDSQQFSSLESEVHKEKKALDVNLLALVSEAPHFTKEALNNTHVQGANFFSTFELFISSVSSEHETLSKVQIQDVITSIENVLKFSAEYWETMISVSKAILGTPYAPEKNFMKTSQSILKTYSEEKSLELRELFKSNGIPTTGFDSKENHRLTSIKIDWVSLVIGIVLLIASGIIIFHVDSYTGMQYFFTRIINSLSIALIFTGVAKNKIQAKINVPGLAITAAGTIAIFLTLYFANPAEMPIGDQNANVQTHNKAIKRNLLLTRFSGHPLITLKKLTRHPL
ncbi:hypothetical protein V6257_17090 [Pseudoalteromonas issachenkonii]|uniref:Uncharacterized protein n=1 Tax=Pseudoalteromonas issachenkonii TaxID=152297 RepID=A0ABU9H4J7_9GAMM